MNSNFVKYRDGQVIAQYSIHLYICCILNGITCLTAVKGRRWDTEDGRKPGEGMEDIMLRIVTNRGGGYNSIASSVLCIPCTFQ